MPYQLLLPEKERRQKKTCKKKLCRGLKRKEAGRKEVSESKRNLLFIREKSNRKLRDILATNARSQVCFQDAPRGGVSQSHPTLTLTLTLTLTIESIFNQIAKPTHQGAVGL
jgi:hypothetical protein